MAETQVAPVATRLEDLRQQFEQWRSARTHPSPIPETLWRAAVHLARRHGVDRTARTLRLEYNALKRRMLTRAATRGARPTFVELSAVQQTGVNDCLIEIHAPSGAVLRIQVAGLATTDVVALTRAVWNGEA